MGRVTKVMKVENVCREIHSLLAVLPVHQSPNEVGFQNGLYFFYEDGERNGHNLCEHRIVRVGNHPRVQSRLIGRLWDHYSGRKNGSVFRRLLGGALIRRNNPLSPCLTPVPGKGHWELQDAKPCPDCQPVEQRVSEYLRRNCQFRCVEISNQQQRNQLEKLLIATIAQCPKCTASKNWLGWSAYSEEVRKVGLWNRHHIRGAAIGLSEFRVFAKLVRITGSK